LGKSDVKIGGKWSSTCLSWKKNKIGFCLAY
jgi:hypothetical protein